MDDKRQKGGLVDTMSSVTHFNKDYFVKNVTWALKKGT